jgi:GH18 family chitinase
MLTLTLKKHALKEIYRFDNDKLNLLSPIYPRKNSQYSSDLSIDSVLNGLIKSGVSPEKIILVLATYGRTYKLVDSSNTRPGSLNNGIGSKGQVL